MVVYGLYAAGTGLVDLAGQFRLEAWVDLAMVLLGGVLVIAAALVRVLVPGGLALALGSMLALQAAAIHNAVHFDGVVRPVPQVVRGCIVGGLVLLAYAGGQRERGTPGP